MNSQSPPGHVIHTVARLAERDGGPTRTVASSCAALARRGVKVDLVTGGVDRSVARRLPQAVEVHEVPSGSLGGRAHPRRGALRSLLARRASEVEAVVVHDHGIWLPSNHAVAVETRKRGVPRVVSPRGMLSEWSLRHHGWKKSIAWALFQRHDLNTANVVHATSEAEALEIRAVDVRRPIAVIPNGVDIPGSQREGRRENGRPMALFLSRIHPKKGLEDLVDAWAMVSTEDWRLTIAGPGDSAYRADLEARARQHGIEAEFVGAVTDDDKWGLYRSADLFVLPTHSENFGVVVAEALACEVPVITTRQAPWSLLEEERCGWWIEDDVDALVEALGRALSIDETERREMGVRGRRVIEERFSWDSAAKSMVEVYRWMSEGGARPECLRLA